MSIEGRLARLEKHRRHDGHSWTVVSSLDGDEIRIIEETVPARGQEIAADDERVVTVKVIGPEVSYDEL